MPVLWHGYWMIWSGESEETNTFNIASLRDDGEMKNSCKKHSLLHTLVFNLIKMSACVTIHGNTFKISSLSYLMAEDEWERERPQNLAFK